MAMRCHRRLDCRVGDRRRVCRNSSMDRVIRLLLHMVMVVVAMVNRVATDSRAVMDNNRVVTDSKELILADRMAVILVRTMDILPCSTMDIMGKDMETETGMATTAIKGSSHVRQVGRI